MRLNYIVIFTDDDITPDVDDVDITPDSRIWNLKKL